MAQRFGGHWTLIKLDMLDAYLQFFTTALKKQTFKLCYIDAFAGSGGVTISRREATIGSALMALKYPFDRFIFIEQDQGYLSALNARAKEQAPDKQIESIHGDCNEQLKVVMNADWKRNRWRGVIFLDPYAMDLRWESLQLIANTKIFDVWYLFPLSALTRCLRRDGSIPESQKAKITSLLGTDDWARVLYREPSQLSLLPDERIERVNQAEIAKYVVARLRSVFPGVAPSPLLLTQSTNSPLFLLCFAVSNDANNALQLALRAANHILGQVGTGNFN